MFFFVNFIILTFGEHEIEIIFRKPLILYLILK